MKSFVALFALTALVNAVPDPQLVLKYPVTYSGLYNQQLVNPYYQPLTRYINGAITPVEPIANQKAKLEHFKAKAEEYEKKGFKPYMAVHPIYKRDAEPEPEPYLPFGVNPMVYRQPALINSPYVYGQPGLINPAIINPVVTYRQEIDDESTPADTQRVSYTQKVLASPFYSALTYPVIRQEERKSVEKRDADSQFLTYPRPYSSLYNPAALYNSAVYPNALHSRYNAFNPLNVPLNVARPIIGY